MKKVLVIGANGRVGSQLVQTLAANGYVVLAGARNDKGEHAGPHIHFKAIDLLSDVDTLAKSMQRVDAVYFVSGSRGKDLLQIDLHGAVKTMQAAERAGVKRYIMLSSIFALQPEKWNEAFLKDLTNYNIAKHYADLYLSTQTRLDYTILQPGALNEETGSGKIAIDSQVPGSNSIANVATTLAALLEMDNTIGKVIMIHDGDTPIKEALEQI